MTAGLGRGLALAGIGVAVGLAVVAALFGNGDLLKRIRGQVAPGTTSPAETARPAADLPNGDLPKDGSPKGASDSAEAGAGAPRPKTGDQAAIDPNRNPLAGPGGAPQGETRAGETPADPQTPSLDILRVEPSGEAVLAGRGAPKAQVELLRDNKAVARATADESGQFAMDGLTLPPGNSELTLRSTTPDGKATEGRASAVVVIDKDRKAQPLVAVSEPDKPTRILSMPSTPPSAGEAPKTASGAQDKAASNAPDNAPAEDRGADRGKPAGAAGTAAQEPPRREAALPKTGDQPGAPAAEPAPVRIVSVDAQEGGRLFVSGRGAAWTSLRLYLNDTLVASGRSGADGRIAFTIGRGVKPGGYQIRIDQVEGESGKVAGRAQVGFTFPAQLAAREPVKEPAKGRAEPGRVAEASPPAKADPSAPRPADKPTPDKAGEPARAAASEPPATPARPDTPASRPADKPAAVSGEAPAMAGGARPTTPEPEKRTADTASPRQPEAGTPPAAGADRAASEAAGRDRSAPPQQAEAPAPASPDGAASEQGATVFVPEIETAKITRGDNLWQISRRSYGDGRRYTVIYDANRDQIRDPNLIYPGQIFVMPKDTVPAAGGPGARRG